MEGDTFFLLFNKDVTYMHVEHLKLKSQNAVHLLFIHVLLRLLVACLNTPTLPNHAHPRDFNENKLIVQKKCYYVFKGCKRHYLVKMERLNRQLSSVFQFKSGRVWASRQACLGRKPV